MQKFLRSSSSFLFFLVYISKIFADVCTPAVTISTSGFSPEVGIDSQGNAIAVWQRNGAGGVPLIQAAFQPIGGAWTTPVTISALHSAEPMISVNDSGQAVVVWINDISGTVQSSWATFGGTWSTPITVGTGTSQPNVSMDDQGYAVATWSFFDGTITMTQAATASFGGSWSSTTTISTPGQDTGLNHIVVELDSMGNAVAILENFTLGSIQTATLPFGGSWTSPVNVSEIGTTFFGFSLALNSLGNAVAVWSEQDANLLVFGATMQFGGSWSTPVQISASGIDSFLPDVDIDVNGNAEAIWSANVGADTLIQSSYLPFMGTWGAPVNVTTSGIVNTAPFIRFDGYGDAFAVWSRDPGTGFNVAEASLMLKGGSWESPPCQMSPVTQNNDSFSLAIDPSGYGVSVFVNDDADFIQASNLAIPPSVTGVNPNSGPTSGGNSVTITGIGFFNVQSVSFGGMNASFTVVSATMITATAPPNAVGIVDVTVTTPVDTSDINSNDQYTYVFSTPTVSGISPRSGPAAGGNVVIITGSNFSNVLNVDFGSTRAPSFTVFSSTEIIAVAPPGNGIVDVTVTTFSGTSPMNASDQYAYIAPTPPPPPPPPSPTAPLPPSNFDGIILKNEFLNVTEYALVATWVASPSPNVVSYRIYKHDHIVAEIPANSPLVFKTALDSKKSAKGYEIVAVNSSGLESVPIKMKV